MGAKKFTLRALSFLMALSLLAGLIPSLPYALAEDAPEQAEEPAVVEETVAEEPVADAAAEDEGTPVPIMATVQSEGLIKTEYSFVSDTYGLGVEGQGSTDGLGWSEWVENTNTTPATLDACGWSLNLSECDKPNSGRGMVEHPGTGVEKNLGLFLQCVETGSSIAFNINVEKSGYYSLYTDFRGRSADEIANNRGIAGDVTIDGTKVGAFNFNRPATEADGSAREVIANDVYLEEGTRVLEFKKNINGGIGTWALLFDITLQETGGEVELDVHAEPYRYLRPNTQGEIKVAGATIGGEYVSLSGAKVTYHNAGTAVTVADNGVVTAGEKTGESLVTVIVEKGDFIAFQKINFVVTNGKIGSTYMDEEEKEAFRRNSEEGEIYYDEKNYMISGAESMLGHDEFLWNHITTQELPRSAGIALDEDPNGNICSYCGKDLAQAYSNIVYAFNLDPINNPFKIQCKSCRKWFPSNDFESFYKLGIDEYGNWSYEKAKSENAKLVASGKEGYLVNKLYPEKGAGWGVDDGYGYITGNTYKDSYYNVTRKERRTYIAYYNRAMMGTESLFDKVAMLGRAYVYTGDKKYGKTAAIILDRLADVYPAMDIEPYQPVDNRENANTLIFPNSGGPGNGKLEGSIWEPDTVQRWAIAYDLVWDCFDEPDVVNFLHEKAVKYKMSNDKSTPEKIRQNIENGILREGIKATTTGDLYGNFGLHQQVVADCAVILDNPDGDYNTNWAIDYLMRADEYTDAPYSHIHTGGEILDRMYNKVDPNGGTAEGLTPNYASLWFGSLMTIADSLGKYERYPSANLYAQPKLSIMQKNQANYFMCRRYSNTVGDSGVMGEAGLISPSATHYATMYEKTGDIEFAQLAYFINGNKVKDINLGRTDINPEIIQRKIQAVINEYGEFDFDKSNLLPFSGYAVMRGGSKYPEKDVQRDFWMTYGKTGQTHAHWDTLNLGLHANGLDVAPDPGYPDQVPEYFRRFWGLGSVSHNTVVVNERSVGATKFVGETLHFDDAGKVKVMDAQDNDNAAMFGWGDNPTCPTDIYRRTVVMVDVDDDISYGVDFFRIKGGSDHLYSFHALSDTISSYSGFTPVKQSTGTYAGTNIAYGNTTDVKNGFSFLDNVRKANNPGTGNIMVDFKVTDFHNSVPVAQSEDMHVRLNMVNDFNLSSVAFANGPVATKPGNPEYLEYLLARRTGSNLDSTFTTVIQPYQYDPYISSVERVDVKRADNGTVTANGDTVSAVKVTLNTGRVDYIVYASNNKVEYIVDNSIRFIGFVGVASLVDGEYIYSYVNDGTKMGKIEDATASYSGTVSAFSRDSLSFEQWLDLDFNGNININELKGRHVYVNNGDVNYPAVYEIKSAQENSDGTVRVNIGNTALYRSATNITATSANVVWNIANGNSISVPLSKTFDAAPQFVSTNDEMVFVDGTMVKDVSAVSAAGRPITYTVDGDLPIGAIFDDRAGTITWTPMASQKGTHKFTVIADDGISATYLRFKVNVMENVFGKSYAYVQETFKNGKPTYNLMVFGGLDSDQYMTAGFEITVDGKTSRNLHSEAYKKINLKFANGTATLRPEQLGVSKNGYIFFDSQTYDASFADKPVRIRAYAIDADGNICYGAYADIKSIALIGIAHHGEKTVDMQKSSRGFEFTISLDTLEVAELEYLASTNGFEIIEK